MIDKLYGGCTIECERMPECLVCRMRKKLVGRDPGVAAANGYCGSDCPGYYQEPRPGHLWPGELKRIREDGKGGAK